MAQDNSKSESDACDLVNGWLDANISRTGWRELSRIHDRELRKSVAGYETDHLLISISAWTQGNCLDIDVLDKRTRRQVTNFDYEIDPHDSVRPGFPKSMSATSGMLCLIA